MSGLQCPKCGAPSRGVCAQCHVKAHPIAVKPETFRDCGCGLGFFKGKWYENRQELLMDLAKKSIANQSDLKLKVLGVDSETQAGLLKLCAHVQGSYSGSVFKCDVKWDIKPEKGKCDSCVKLGSGYYEAILQVRDGIELDLDHKQISSIEKTRGGHDFYMISMNYAQQKVQELINRGFLTKQSSKLYGKKNGKDVFRFYYSIKRPHFAEGDFLEHDGKILRVKGLAKAVKMIDVATGKPIGTTLHRMEDAKLLAKSADVKKATVTEVRPNGMQLLDEDGIDHYEVKVKEGVNQGQEVEYVKLTGKVYLLE